MGVWAATGRTIVQEYRRVLATPGALYSGQIGIAGRAKLAAYKTAALATAWLYPEGRKIDLRRQAIIEDVAIVWDLGGTNLRVSAVNASGEIITEILKADTEGIQKRATRKDKLEDLTAVELADARDAVVAEMTRMILKVKDAVGHREIPVNILNIAGSFAGPLTEKGTVIKGPNVVGFENYDLAQTLMRNTSIPSFIINDAVAGARSEEFYGLGKSVTGNFGWVTISTGFGGTFRVGKSLVGVEVGHLPSDIALGVADVECGCTLFGCAEVFAGKGLPLIALKERTQWTHPIVDESNLHARAIINMANGGDPYFSQLVLRSATAIASAIRTAAIIQRPKKVCVSGSMGKNAVFFKKLQAVFTALPRPMMFSESEWQTMLVMAEVAEPGLAGAGAETFRRAGYLAA